MIGMTNLETIKNCKCGNKAKICNDCSLDLVGPQAQIIDTYLNRFDELWNSSDDLVKNKMINIEQKYPIDQNVLETFYSNYIGFIEKKIDQENKNYSKIIDKINIPENSSSTDIANLYLLASGIAKEHNGKILMDSKRIYVYKP